MESKRVSDEIFSSNKVFGGGDRFFSDDRVKFLGILEKVALLNMGMKSYNIRLPKETQAIHLADRLEGWIAYLAPEQTRRMNRGIDDRTNFYRLGVTISALLKGELPFQSIDPLELPCITIDRAMTEIVDLSHPTAAINS
jgi:serine/threonine protein kinase